MQRSRESKAAAAIFLQQWIHSRELAQRVNLQVMQGEGLSATLLTVLRLLDPERPISVNKLAAHMNVHPSTIVRSLDQLETEGYVVRDRNPKDRRELQVTLSSRGQAVQQRVLTALAKHMEQIFEAMSVEGREALLRGFEEFSQKSRDVAQAPTVVDQEASWSK